MTDRSRAIRRLVVLVAASTFYMITVAYAATELTQERSLIQQWLTPQTIFTMALLVYHIGKTQSEIATLRRDHDKLALEVEKEYARVDVTAQTYVTRDRLDSMASDMNRHSAGVQQAIETRIAELGRAIGTLRHNAGRS